MHGNLGSGFRELVSKQPTEHILEELIAQRFSEIVILKLVDLCLANYIRKITQKNTFANALKILRIVIKFMKSSSPSFINVDTR